jgi:predicted DNA-binding transcriptional regulator YafY
MLARARRRALPLDEVAARLEVHRRTARRYVQALAESCTTEDGRPLVGIEGRGVEARVVLADEGEPTSARIYQYAAVFAATRALTAAGGSALGDSAEQLLSSLEKGFETRLQPLVRRVQECFVYVPFGPKDYRASEETLDAVIQASMYRHLLHLRYRTRSGWEYACLFEPWAVVLYRDALFVHGLQRDTGSASGVRLLAVDRVREVEVLRGEHFEVPPDYDPQAWFSGQLGLWHEGGAAERVRIAFSVGAASAARERVWPGQVGWSQADDGREVLELEIPVTPEVQTWVLTWGAEAEVLEPVGFREGVAAVLRGAAGRYPAGSDAPARRIQT